MVSNNTNTVADQARKAVNIKTLGQALESFLLVSPVSMVFLFLVSFLKSIFQRLQGLEVRFYHQGHDVRYSTRLFRAQVLAFSSSPPAAQPDTFLYHLDLLAKSNHDLDLCSSSLLSFQITQVLAFSSFPLAAWPDTSQCLLDPSTMSSRNHDLCSNSLPSWQIFQVELFSLAQVNQLPLQIQQLPPLQIAPQVLSSWAVSS